MKPIPSRWPCLILTPFVAHTTSTQEMADLVTSVGGRRGLVARPVATGVTAEAQTFHSAPHHVEPSVLLQTLSFSVYSAGERNEGVAGHRQCCLLKPCQAHGGVGKSAWGRASQNFTFKRYRLAPSHHWTSSAKVNPAVSLQVRRFSEVNKEMLCLYMM